MAHVGSFSFLSMQTDISPPSLPINMQTRSFLHAALVRRQRRIGKPGHCEANSVAVEMNGTSRIEANLRQTCYKI